MASQLNAEAAQTPIVIDWDHQTIYTTVTGIQAPAAGWITAASWEDGQGLFATVNWTDKALRAIEAKEYLYISPVIEWDDKTGEITKVLLAALVNYPALVGMEAVQAQQAALAAYLKTQHTELPKMNLLLQLLAALGLPADTTEATALTAVTSMKAAIDEAKTKQARPAIPAALTAALGIVAGADEAAHLAAITAIKAADKGAGEATALAGALTQVAALQGEVATLRATMNETDVARMADEAIAAGKFVPAFRDQLVTLGRKDKAQLSAFIAAATPIPALSQQAQDTAAAAAAAQAASGSAAALSGADALAVAKQMGISPEAWIKGLPKAA